MNRTGGSLRFDVLLARTNSTWRRGTTILPVSRIRGSGLDGSAMTDDGTASPAAVDHRCSPSTISVAETATAPPAGVLLDSHSQAGRFSGTPASREPRRGGCGCRYVDSICGCYCLSVSFPTSCPSPALIRLCRTFTPKPYLNSTGQFAEVLTHSHRHPPSDEAPG